MQVLLIFCSLDFIWCLNWFSRFLVFSLLSWERFLDMGADEVLRLSIPSVVPVEKGLKYLLIVHRCTVLVLKGKLSLRWIIHSFLHYMLLSRSWQTCHCFTLFFSCSFYRLSFYRPDLHFIMLKMIIPNLYLENHNSFASWIWILWLHAIQTLDMDAHYS